MTTKQRKKEVLYQTLLLKKRNRGLRDLYFFNKYILERKEERQKMLVSHVHKEWARWYEGGKSRVKIILVPRGCFKSTFFTVGRTIQAICQNRDERILIANATLGNAQNFVGEIKEHLRKNELLKELYGEFHDKNIKWNEEEIEVLGRSLGNREPTVSAAGVGGNLVSRHYSKIIADDLVNLDNSATRQQADKVIDWWKRAFSLLDYDGEMIIIGTRWSYYELYSWIMDKYPGKADIFLKGAYNLDGSLYFPELLDEEKLQELKGLQGSYIFSSFYLNDPVDESSALIKKSQIKYWGEGEDVKLPRHLLTFSVCDPAVSQESGVDKTSIIVVGIDVDNNWYVLDVRTGKWTVHRLIEELFAVKNQWKPEAMSLEVIGQGQGIMTPIHDEENIRNEYLPLVEIKARGQITKDIRIRSVLQPRFERGKVFLRRDMYDLEEQILKFPRMKSNDMIDALADLEQISFTPAKGTAEGEGMGGFFEQALRKQVENKGGPVDTFLGEEF